MLRKAAAAGFSQNILQRLSLSAVLARKLLAILKQAILSILYELTSETLQLKLLDLHKPAKRGMASLLPFTSFWATFCTMDSYVKTFLHMRLKSFRRKPRIR